MTSRTDARERTYTIILGGGRGERVYPPTPHRAKPAGPRRGQQRRRRAPLVSVMPVPRSGCAGFGVVSTDADGRIRAFREKPRTDTELLPLSPPVDLRAAWGLSADEFVASMGVYIFRMETVREVLADPSMLD